MSKATVSRRNFLSTLAASAIALSSPNLHANQEPKNLEQLVTSLRSIDGLRVSKPKEMDPSKKTVIIYKDIHYDHGEGSTETDMKYLEQIRKQTGINNIAIEGWAGHKVDQERGYRLLNAQEGLIEKLIDDANYQVLPLEEKNLQYDAMVSLLIHLNNLGKDKGEIEILYEWQKEIQRSDRLANRANQILKQYEIARIEENQGQIKYLEKEYPHFLDNMDEIQGALALAQENKDHYNSWVKQAVSSIGLPITSVEDMVKEINAFKQKYAKQYSKDNQYTKEEDDRMFDFDKFKEDILMDQRSKVAAQKYHNSNPKDFGIMFYGRAHADQISNYLNQVGNYNIIFVEPKSQIERSYQEQQNIFDLVRALRDADKHIEELKKQEENKKLE